MSAGAERPPEKTYRHQVLSDQAKRKEAGYDDGDVEGIEIIDRKHWCIKQPAHYDVENNRHGDDNDRN